MKILLRTLGVVLLTVLAAPLLWTTFTSDTYVTVTGVSMQPTYNRGDILVVARPTGDELTRKGQSVVVRFPGSKNQSMYVHRVHEPLRSGAWLKGDNNKDPDPSPVTQNQVAGTPRLAIQGAAAPVFTALQTPAGRITLALVAVILLIVPIRTAGRRTAGRRAAGGRTSDHSTAGGRTSGRRASGRRASGRRAAGQHADAPSATTPDTAISTTIDDLIS